LVSIALNVAYFTAALFDDYFVPVCCALQDKRPKAVTHGRSYQHRHINDRSDYALSPIERVKREEVKPVEVSEREAAFEENLTNLEEELEHAHSFVQTPAGVMGSLEDEQA
jgi:hypothetical protein